MSYMGCSDHGCVFGHPGGQGTNGGCHCLEARSAIERASLREKILALRKERDEARAEVSRLKSRSTVIVPEGVDPSGAIADLKGQRDDLLEELAAAKLTCQIWIEQCKTEVAQREWERKKRESLTAKARAVVGIYYDPNVTCDGSIMDAAMSALAAEIGEGGKEVKA